MIIIQSSDAVIKSESAFGFLRGLLKSGQVGLGYALFKRRLQLASINSSEAPAPGTEIFHSADPEQPCGMVVMAAHNPSISEEITLQVECKLEAMQSGSIHLKSIQGPQLRFEALPYPLIEI